MNPVHKPDLPGASPLPLPLQEAYRTAVVPTGDGGSKKFDSNVSAAEALLLYQVVSELKPQLSVEVGLALGASTSAILQALEDAGAPAKHHVLDPFQATEWKNAGLEMIRRAGLAHRCEFHSAYAEEVIPGLEQIDFAFIDASHLFDLTLSEFVLCDKKLRVGGVIGFHDLWMDPQQKLLRFILTNRHYEPLPHAPAKTGRTARQSFARLLSALPLADRVINPKFLQPATGAEYGNLFLLRKTAGDDRPSNGRHYVDF
jgi:predicted O-methyltransferase YrrM